MKIFLNVLAVIAGFLIGSILNSSLIELGWRVILPPAGVNVGNVESVAAGAHLFEAKHYLFPFVGHAAGAWVGALIAHLIARTRRTVFAFMVGGIFLLGGITAAFLIPSPIWFTSIDVLGAYLPMVWLAVRVGRKIRPEISINNSITP